MSIYLEGILVLLGINMLMAMSVHVILTTGQVSLGNAGFMAIGAYLSSYLTVNAGMPLELALLCGAAFSGGIGILLGLPILRLQGVFLVLATLAFGEMTASFFLNFEPTGGASGFRGPIGTTFAHVLVAVIAVSGIMWAVERSRLGRSLDAVRDDPLAASFVGIDVTRLKVGVFGFGAALAGLAGGLFAHYAMYIEPHQFSFLVSAIAVLYVILGGAQTFIGALLGATVFTLIPEALRSFGSWRMVIFGAVLVLLMVVRPEGLITRDLLRKIKTWFGLPRRTAPIPPTSTAKGGDHA